MIKFSSSNGVAMKMFWWKWLNSWCSIHTCAKMIDSKSLQCIFCDFKFSQPKRTQRATCEFTASYHAISRRALRFLKIPSQTSVLCTKLISPNTKCFFFNVLLCSVYFNHQNSSHSFIGLDTWQPQRSISDVLCMFYLQRSVFRVRV